MKSFFLIVALAMFAAVQAITDEQRKEIKALCKKCIEETGVDEELMKKVTMEGHWEIEDAKLKSYSFCMMKKFGIMGEDGSMHIEAAVAQSEPKDQKKVAEAMEKCMKLVGANNDETAWNVFKCYQAENPDHGMY